MPSLSLQVENTTPGHPGVAHDPGGTTHEHRSYSTEPVEIESRAGPGRNQDPNVPVERQNLYLLLSALQAQKVPAMARVAWALLALVGH